MKTTIPNIGRIRLTSEGMADCLLLLELYRVTKKKWREGDENVRCVLLEFGNDIVYLDDDDEKIKAFKDNTHHDDIKDWLDSSSELDLTIDLN